MTTEKFWGRVAVRGDEECWIFMYFGNGDYPLVYTEDGRHVTAHKFAYECLVGEVPSGCDLHHRCENKMCVNPRHLEPLTKPEHRAQHLTNSSARL